MRNIKFKSFFVLFSLITLGFSVQAQESNPIKWGIGLGAGLMEFEQTENIEDDELIMTADLGITMVTLDASSGKHSFSYSTATASEEAFDITGSYVTNSTATGRTRGQDYSDNSFTYMYQLAPKWRIGFGYNNQTMDGSLATVFDGYSSDTSFTGGNAQFYPNNEDKLWGFTNAGSVDREISGATFLVSYVTPLGSSGKWFLESRIGVTEQDYKNTYDGGLAITGFTPFTQTCYNGGACPTGFGGNFNIGSISAANGGPGILNGDGYKRDWLQKSDTQGYVTGFTLIYSVNPKNSISFGFATRDNDYGSLDQTYTSVPLGGLITRGGSTTAENTEDFEREVEEYQFTWSVRWRYALN